MVKYLLATSFPSWAASNSLPSVSDKAWEGQGGSIWLKACSTEGLLEDKLPGPWRNPYRSHGSDGVGESRRPLSLQYLYKWEQLDMVVFPIFLCIDEAPMTRICQNWMVGIHGRA